VSVANKLPSVWEIIACVQPNKVGKIDRRMEKSEKGGAVGKMGGKQRTGIDDKS